MKCVACVSVIISLIDIQFELCPFNGILMGLVFMTVDCIAYTVPLTPTPPHPLLVFHKTSIRYIATAPFAALRESALAMTYVLARYT
jgi:hypothetical protein